MAGNLAKTRGAENFRQNYMSYKCGTRWVHRLVKNYMSDKIGAADSGIITIDQPAGLASENII